MKKLLLLLAIAGLSNLVQAQDPLPFEGFEGTTFPPTGWVRQNTVSTPANQWRRSTTTPISGSASATVVWVAAQQDERLITPTFTLSGQNSAYLNFSVRLGYEYFVDPFDNCNFTVAISTDGGTTYTDLWNENDLGEYIDYEIFDISLNLSAYLGQSNCKVRFRYDGNDGDTARLDNVSVTTCPIINSLAISSLTTTEAVITWDSLSTSFTVEYGPEGFTQGTGTVINTNDETATFTNLTEGTAYNFYIKNSCETVFDGPYVIYTPLVSNANTDYSYGFEAGNFSTAGWDNTVAPSGGPWDQFLAGAANADFVQEGEGFAAVVGAAVDSDAWLFSRGISLTAGVNYTVRYYLRKLNLGTGASENNNLEVKIGSEKTAAGQSVLLNTHEAIDFDIYELQQATFTPTTSGVYYVGFHSTTGIQDAATVGATLIDLVSVSAPLSVDNPESAIVSVYPNPVIDLINVSNLGTGFKAATLTDINGRIVKRVPGSSLQAIQIPVADLSAGVYMLNLTTNEGATTTFKVVKK
ncbi:T9SS-dependent choice-of-anchor J family protein [Flavobacterium aurantiibacter]|uniref:Fibronectin type-III domain-containing protein n=1 Tax=Flavobacterium aurantiibacter TaxID=2023067 RepID=A0A256A0V7_9FLAO|nr:choice-of-anchor J domain-containing protein [Flavobacterium aurantiibacter]OYQ46744.1 hypothetical protein CHX27_04185 [Flavobacterium aurantiibacter]